MDVPQSHFEIQAHCKVGCDDHPDRESWRKSKRLPAGTSVGAALDALAEHTDKFPQSAPYRLVSIRPAYEIPEAVLVLAEATPGSVEDTGMEVT